MADSGKVTDLHKLKVAELKKLLKDKGLSVIGNKAELVGRLSGIADGSLDSDLIEDDSVLDESLEPASTEPSSPEPTVKKAIAATKVTKLVTSKLPAEPSSKPANNGAVKITAPASTDSAGIAARMKRFGVVSEDARKAARQERFQSATAGGDDKKSAVGSKPAAPSDEMLKKRAERFGVVSSAETPSAGTASSGKATGIDVGTLKKRADRFGQVTATKLAKVEEQDRALKRKQRFGVITAPGTVAKATAPAEVNEARKRRLDRFGATVITA